MRYYESIQALRGIAAVAVVVHHAAVYFDFHVGSAGVDLFFVISGFIMVSISRFFGEPIKPSGFLYRRIVRLVPLYWVYTTATLLLFLAMPSQFRSFHAEPLNSMGSYLFVPYPRTDGTRFPVVGAGWTLNMEMLFYAVFAIALCLRHRTAFVVAVMLAFSCYGLVVPISTWWENWYASPMYIEFLYGMGIGWLVQRNFKMPQTAAILFVAAGVVLLAVFRNEWGVRALSWGLPCAMIMLGAVYLERQMPRPLIVLGDASYSIYLSHAMTVAALQRFVPKDHLVLVGIVSAIAIAVGVFAFRFVEKPLLLRLRTVTPFRYRPQSS